MSGTQLQVLPFGAFSRQLWPAGQLPPQAPAPPFGTSMHGIVVVVVTVVVVVEVVGVEVVVLVDDVVVVTD